MDGDFTSLAVVKSDLIEIVSGGRLREDDWPPVNGGHSGPNHWQTLNGHQNENGPSENGRHSGDNGRWGENSTWPPASGRPSENGPSENGRHSTGWARGGHRVFGSVEPQIGGRKLEDEPVDSESPASTEAAATAGLIDSTGSETTTAVANNGVITENLQGDKYLYYSGNVAEWRQRTLCNIVKSQDRERGKKLSENQDTILYFQKTDRKKQIQRTA